MESLKVAWGFFLLATVFVFPYLLGILLYHRLHRAPRWLARIVGILAPAALFFWLAPILFFEDVRAASARGETCGLPALAAAVFLLFGTGVQVVVGLVTHAVLAFGRK